KSSSIEQKCGATANGLEKIQVVRKVGWALPDCHRLPSDGFVELAEMARSLSRLRPAIVYSLATRQRQTFVQGYCNPAWSVLPVFQFVLVQALRPFSHGPDLCKSGVFGGHPRLSLKDRPRFRLFFNRDYRLSRFADRVRVFAVRPGRQLQLRHPLYP